MNDSRTSPFSPRPRTGLGRLRLRPVLESLEPRTLFSLTEPASITFTGAFSGAPFTISYDQLVSKTGLTANTTNLSFIITSIPAGGALTLTHDGVTSLATVGSHILQGSLGSNDSLTFTPNSNKKGNLNAFSFRATNGNENGTNPTKVRVATSRSAQLVSIKTTDNTAIEGTTNNGAIVVTRTGNTSSILDVPLTIAGTGTLGTHFRVFLSDGLNASTEITTALSTIEFPADITSLTLTIVPVDDAAADPTLTPTFTLGSDPNTANPAFGLLTNKSASSLNIIDDTPTLTITPVATGIPEGGSNQLAFTITRATPAGVASANQTFTVNFSGGTFTAANVLGVDQGNVVFSGSGANLTANITFPAGVTSQTIFLTTIDNAIAEGNKTIVARIVADPSFSLAANGTATLNVIDAAPTVALQPVVTTAAEANNTANQGRFLVTRTGSTALDQTVTFTIPNGSSNAVAGADFILLSSGAQLIPTASGTLNTFTVTIPAGKSSVPVLVRALDNGINSNLTVSATLATTTAFNLGAVKTANVTITNHARTPIVINKSFPRLAALNGNFTLTYNDLRSLMGASLASGSHGNLQISVVSISLGTLTLTHNGSSSTAAAGTLISAGDTITWTAPANTTIPTRTAVTFTAVDGTVTATANSTMVVTIL